MDHSGQKPEFATNACLSDDDCGPDRAGSTNPRAKSDADAALRLISNRLVLAEPGPLATPEWRGAISALAAAYEIAMAPAPPDRASGLKQIARWATAANASGTAPVFAPWQRWSPAAFQYPRGGAALPRAQWIASYLFDCGAGRGAAARGVDTMLMSPHPDACLDEDDCNAALPRIATVNAMLEAAATERRNRVAIIVHARCRNAMARRLLAADRSLTRNGAELDILSIEDAIGRLIGAPAGWDAIIVVPELRSIVFAILAEMTGIAGPWPLVWHNREVRMVAGETLGASSQHSALDATLLMQGLALFAHHAGMGFAARRIYQGWARLRDNGVVTPARGSAAPYVKQVADTDFVTLACANRIAAGRPLPEWKAISRDHGNQILRSPVSLSIVASH